MLHAEVFQEEEVRSNMTSYEVRTVLLRFLRTLAPQMPALIAYIGGVKPEWVSLAVFLGAIVTATDKFCRDRGLY